jgi:hypothetical protein
MAEIFSAIAVAVSALTLIVAIVIYNKIKLFPARGGTSDDTYRLEQKLDKIGYLTENNAQNMQGFAEYSAKNQSAQLAGMQAKMDELNRLTEQRLNDITRILAGEIKYMSEQNAKNLEQIRQTVDEKLSSTLENRLNKSYSLINERLEAVYKGIGEVQQLAGSVSDIKKVFTNVKLRGTWGEVQLSALLEQMLSPNQYRANVRINPLDNAVVEFAVLLPSREDETVYLPVDSKFPVEEYQRLIDAGDAMNKEAADKALKNLERALKLQADTIAKKYILPPLTADFAIMFLPLEGLYAETLKIPGLSEYFASRRIMACGPTNFGALLTTLQIGYKTAAIEKRSGELWELLSAFKHEFGNFVKILEKTQKKLQEAQDTIESAAKKTRTIERKLKNVAEISPSRADLLLGDGDDEPDGGENEVT